MNGRPPADAGGKAALPWFDVVAGEKVTFTVTVTVPAHAEMTKLFLGITTGGVGGVGPRGPIGMVPVLATASRLTAGPHRFTLHWTVPRGGRGALLGYEVSGAAYWPRGTKGEPGRRGGPDGRRLTSNRPEIRRGFSYSVAGGSRVACEP